MSEICFILYLLVQISLFFLHYCSGGSWMWLLSRPFVPSPGLSCWICLRADPPSCRPDTDTDVDINPQHLYFCVRPWNSSDLQIRSLYFAVTPSAANWRNAGILCCPACHVILLTCSKWSRSPEAPLQLDQVDAESGWLLDVNTQNGFAKVSGGADTLFTLKSQTDEEMQQKHLS